MAVYTKKGDKGETKVFDKKTGELSSVRKDSCHVKTIGAIDELNSYLGVIGGLTEIQRNLFTINSILAGADLSLPSNATKKLELEIDTIEAKLPVLQNFIIYSGTKKATQLFYARAIARRAERELTEFSKEQEVPEEVQKYVNRLSDYLFMMARFINFKEKVKEEMWIVDKK